jgi:hypothetical protein
MTDPEAVDRLLPHAPWTFDASVAHVFDKHARAIDPAI